MLSFIFFFFNGLKKKAFHRNAMNYEKQSYIPAHIVVHIESELSEPLLQAG